MLLVATYGDPTNEGIAERLEGLRRALNFRTQAAFAAHLDFTPSQYGNYVQARNRISLDEAIEVARRTQATLDWIYLGNPAGLPFDLARALFGEPEPQAIKATAG